MRLSLIVEQVRIYANLTFTFKVALWLLFKVTVSTTTSSLLYLSGFQVVLVFISTWDGQRPVNIVVHHISSKQDTWFFVITSADVDQFSKFIHCYVKLIFALIFMTLTDICGWMIKSHILKHILCVWKVQNFLFLTFHGNAATYLRCDG